MENNIVSVMEKYIEQVNMLCTYLLENINQEETLNLRTKNDFFEYRQRKRKTSFIFEDMEYHLHGRGCAAFNKKTFCDWDFGYRSRWCGISPWLLSRTLNDDRNNYTFKFDGIQIEKVCEKLVLNNKMFKKYDLYYFNIPLNEKVIPEFPKEFDLMIIKRFDEEWHIPRNKIVDKFIRKSSQIYAHIDENPDCYMLKFIRNSEEVACVPYDDIGYPENAITIMDTILSATSCEKSNRNE